MLINPHSTTPPLGRIMHGGDLAQARRLFPGTPEPFIDLSTGINPFSYPLPQIPLDSFRRLPDSLAVQRLAEIAVRAFGAPAADCVVPAPGTQILLPLVVSLVAPGRAAILGPTYAEHLRAAQIAGHDASIVINIEDTRDADLVVVVNPNNPDGRIIPRSTLLQIADGLSRTGGILVVDEAFVNVAPGGTSVAGDVTDRNIIVLRSFGKFFGLAGLRLGFALARRELAVRLDALLGPWAVSGAALHVGALALADETWRQTTVAKLAQAAERLDGLLVTSGLEVLGGTSLFRLTRSKCAGALFEHMARAGILVRRFEEHEEWLRWGLPCNDGAWHRVQMGLADFLALGPPATRI